MPVIAGIQLLVTATMALTISARTDNLIQLNRMVPSFRDYSF
jgi:hypothetical protein